MVVAHPEWPKIMGGIPPIWIDDHPALGTSNQSNPTNLTIAHL